MSGTLPAATEGGREHITHQALRAWTAERQAFEFDRELIWMDERVEPDRQQWVEARDALCELLRRLVRVGDSPAERRDDEITVAHGGGEGAGSATTVRQAVEVALPLRGESRAASSVQRARSAWGERAGGCHPALTGQGLRDQPASRCARDAERDAWGKRASHTHCCDRQMSAPELTAVSAYAARMERVVAGCAHGRRRMLESMLVRRPRASLRTEMRMRAEMRTLFRGTLHEVEDVQGLPSQRLTCACRVHLADSRGGRGARIAECRWGGHGAALAATAKRDGKRLRGRGAGNGTSVAGPGNDAVTSLRAPDTGNQCSGTHGREQGLSPGR